MTHQCHFFITMKAAPVSYTMVSRGQESHAAGLRTIQSIQYFGVNLTPMEPSCGQFYMRVRENERK